MSSFFSLLGAIALAVLLLSVVGVAFLVVGGAFALALGAYRVREMLT